MYLYGQVKEVQIIWPTVCMLCSTRTGSVFDKTTSFTLDCAGIKASYERKGVSLPQVYGHSMTNLWALFHGLDIKQICLAADWSNCHTFLLFYCWVSLHHRLHSVLCDQGLVASRLSVCVLGFTRREADYFITLIFLSHSRTHMRAGSSGSAGQIQSA